MFSETVFCGSRLKLWKMNPSRRRRRSLSSLSLRSATSCPSIRQRPFVGRSRHPSRFSIVDLPEPDGPMIAQKSPPWKSIVTPSSARTAVWPIM